MSKKIKKKFQEKNRNKKIKRIYSIHYNKQALYVKKAKKKIQEKTEIKK